jgi:hypothetical protein
VKVPLERGDALAEPFHSALAGISQDFLYCQADGHFAAAWGLRASMSA